jgi:hypothetical protein
MFPPQPEHLLFHGVIVEINIRDIEKTKSYLYDDYHPRNFRGQPHIRHFRHSTYYSMEKNCEKESLEHKYFKLVK